MRYPAHNRQDTYRMIRALGWQITRTTSPQAKWQATSHEGTTINGRTFEELLDMIRANRTRAWL